MRRTLLLAGLMATVMPPGVQAQEHHSTVLPDMLRWTSPGAYAPGAMLAVLQGDPSKAGMYIVRLKVPAGYVIPAHTHPNDENVTVLSGSFNIGTGGRVDKSAGTRVPPGGYSFVARNMQHYAWFTEDTVLQLHGMGPQGVTYVNPADDPRIK